MMVISYIACKMVSHKYNTTLYLHIVVDLIVVIQLRPPLTEHIFIPIDQFGIRIQPVWYRHEFRPEFGAEMRCIRCRGNDDGRQAQLILCTVLDHMFRKFLQITRMLIILLIGLCLLRHIEIYPKSFGQSLRCLECRIQ